MDFVFAQKELAAIALRILSNGAGAPFSKEKYYLIHCQILAS